jgi:hypothetical protein
MVSGIFNSTLAALPDSHSPEQVSKAECLVIRMDKIQMQDVENICLSEFIKLVTFKRFRSLSVEPLKQLV